MPSSRHKGVPVQLAPWRVLLFGALIICLLESGRCWRGGIVVDRSILHKECFVVVVVVEDGGSGGVVGRKVGLGSVEGSVVQEFVREFVDKDESMHSRQGKTQGSMALVEPPPPLISQ